MTEPIRVLVVDDQRLIRDGIASLLSIEPGLLVVGTAGDGQAALDLVEQLRPDVVLMDVRMPTMDGVTAAEELRRTAPDCRVLMLTTFDDEEYVVRALRARASGYLLKDVPSADLAQAIRLVHAGVDQYDPAVVARFVGALDRGAPPPPLSTGTSPTARSLTARELDVLRLVAQGDSNKEIAGRLFVSEGTVKNHVSNILSRLGLRDRTQAAIYARDHNLL